ncbi:MAG TPA: hypothetical protein PLT98_04355 [Thauera aminoaromatica]|nr:hypothetical protein [Myxococcota bacterium]HMY77955.1 hypothetical protein [Thauera aminoaromatica]
MADWTYEEYWSVVLGQGSASEIVAEYDLTASDSRGLSEWLGQAEAEAWRVGGNGAPVPSEWAEYHQRTLVELTGACEEVQS